MSRDQLRTAALEIFTHTLLAVDARNATRNAIRVNGTRLRVKESEFDLSTKGLYVVGMGKAALSMSLGLQDVLDDRVSAAVVSTTAPTTPLPLSSRYQFF